MRQLKQMAESWWEQRTERERMLLVPGALLLVAAALFNFGYKPMADQRRLADDEFARTSQDYNWLKIRLRDLERMAPEGGGLFVAQTPERMRSIFEERLAKMGLRGAVELVKKGAKRQLKISIEEANGGKLMQWVESLVQDGYQVSGLRLKNNGGKMAGQVIVRVA